MKTNSTQENLKKYFYTGIGHISHTGDVMQKSAKEFARQGKVTETDGKRIVNNAIWEIERKYNEAVHKLAKFTRNEVAKLQSNLGKVEKQVMIKKPDAHVMHLVKSPVKRHNHHSGRTARMAT